MQDYVTTTKNCMALYARAGGTQILEMVRYFIK